MKPKWQKLAGLAQEICTLLFQFFGTVFASKGYPFKNIIHKANDKGADQTARMHRLVCACVVRKPRRQVFWRCGPYM